MSDWWYCPLLFRSRPGRRSCLPARLRGKVYTNVPPLQSDNVVTFLKSMTFNYYKTGHYAWQVIATLLTSNYYDQPSIHTNQSKKQSHVALCSSLEKFLKNGSVADSNHRHGRCGGCCPGKGVKIGLLSLPILYYDINLNYCSNVQGGTVSEGFTFAASDT